MHLESIDQLRTLYPPAKERARLKQLSALESHSLRFLSLSPFLVLASQGADGLSDASPRGGSPGFVKAPDTGTLLIPDSPGNNRLDTLENIIATGRIGALFMIPGVDETLRVNGIARLTTDAQRLAAFSKDKLPPKLVIEVQVKEVYLHCAKALMRSHLWAPQAIQPRSVLPTMGEMINGQIGAEGPPESQEQMLARYAADL